MSAPTNAKKRQGCGRDKWGTHVMAVTCGSERGGPKSP